MAKPAKKKPPVEGEKKQTKKRGLFSFLRRKKKNPEDIQVVEQETVEIETVIDAAPKDAKSKSPAKNTIKTAAKTAAKPATKPATKPANKKAAANNAGKPPVGKKPATAKAPAGKTTGKRTSKKPADAEIAALEIAEDDAIVEKPKRKLFGFLKRKKKQDPTADLATGNGIAAKSEIDLDAQDIPQKKGLFGLLKRKKKIGDPSDANAVDAIEAVANVDIVDGDEDAVPKKRFLSKKIILIIVGLFSVMGATGAAAVVFAGPMIFGEEIDGLACNVVFETDFTLMREQRVTSFIRADIMPPKQRVLLVIQYAKYLAELYPDSQLVSVSVLDTNGPATRPEFRGTNIGAQAVFAADPLLTQATKQAWEVRYVNTDKTYSGKFLGDRYELSEDEITALRTEIIEPSGCFVPEVELTDEEMAEKEKLEAEELAAAEKAAEMAAEELAAEEANMEAMAAVHAEPGMIDNLLGMVGLGGSTENSDEHMDQKLDVQDNVPLEDTNASAFPGDKRGVPEIVYEEDKGFMDGVLGMVGLGKDGDEMSDDAANDTLGTKISYN
jgi:hypothetical protein